jgi:hypothetical protein
VQEEKRTFLRQALEARLISLLLDIQNYTQVWYSLPCRVAVVVVAVVVQHVMCGT